MFRFRGTCSVWERYRTDKALLPARASHRRKPGTGCKGEALDGGRGGVPHNKVPPSPGEEAVSQVQRAAISAIPTFVFGRFHQ